MPPVAYPLSVKLSAIGKVSVERVCVESVRVGTGAPARPSRAQLGRLSVGGGRSPV